MFEFLFNATRLAFRIKVSRKKALLPDYFSLQVKQKRKEEKRKDLTLISPPLLLYPRKSGTTRLRRAISVSCSQRRCSRQAR